MSEEVRAENCSDFSHVVQSCGRIVHEFYGTIYANKENGKLESNKRMWLYEKAPEQAYEQQRHAHYCGKGGAEVAVAYGGEPDCVHRHKPAGYYKKVVHICASVNIILKSSIKYITEQRVTK